MKKSVAYNHFPQVVVQDNRFWLFNPILKKRYENRPEERVRLQWVEYLLHQTDWKKSRIGFETPVKLQQSKNTLRADLVLYSDEMKPHTLIECKSDTVNLNQAVAVQAARYNMQVKARHLVLTNGIEDYWFERADDSIEEEVNFFDEEFCFPEIKRDHNYWYRRGFCSKEINTELKDWLVELLNNFWSEGTERMRLYLDFKQTLLPVPMNQYYKLIDIDSDRRVAISFSGSDFADSHLIAILNEEGTNRAILSVNLAKITAGEKEAILLFKNGDILDITSKKRNSKTLISFNSSELNKLIEMVMKFFD